MILYSDQDYPVGDLFREMTTDFLDRASNEGVTEVGDWQALDVSALPQGRTIELRNAIFEYQIPENDLARHKEDQDEGSTLQDEIGANQPWAEDHFQERVSGKPLNPGEQYKNWPWFKANVPQHQTELDVGFPSLPATEWAYLGALIDGEGCVDTKVNNGHEYWRVTISQKNEPFLERLHRKFMVGRVNTNNRGSSTWRISAKGELTWLLDQVRYYVVLKRDKVEKALYCTRALLGKYDYKSRPIPEAEPRFSHTYMERFWPRGHTGIRYRYGDLNDLVSQLARSPATRQAYLPVWFPEDTGAVHGQRVPCSLGYHFLLREGRLHCTYLIRSCDFLRHFRDDVYLAARLVQWVLEQVVPRTGPSDARDPEADSPWATAQPGTLTMWMGSFHVFEGDLPNLRRRLR